MRQWLEAVEQKGKCDSTGRGLKVREQTEGSLAMG